MPALKTAAVALAGIDREDVTFRLRRHLDIEPLMESIAEDGLHHPVLLRAQPDDPLLQVVSGFRRVAAVQALGHTEILAEIRTDLTHEAAFAIALRESALERTVSDVDRAIAILQFRLRTGTAVRDVARLAGLTRHQIQRLLRLALAPEPLRGAVAAGRITAAHALELLAALGPDSTELNLWITRIDQLQLTVAELRWRLGTVASPPQEPLRPPFRPNHLSSREQELLRPQLHQLLIQLSR